MPQLIRIGDEIINLDNVARVELGRADGRRPTVLVYFIGDERTRRSLPMRRRRRCGTNLPRWPSTGTCLNRSTPLPPAQDERIGPT